MQKYGPRGRFHVFCHTHRAFRAMHRVARLLQRVLWQMRSALWQMASVIKGRSRLLGVNGCEIGVGVTENHIRQLHRDLLHHSDKDMLH